MKFIALFLLLGLARASLEEKFDETDDEYIPDVLEGMNQEPSIEHHVVYDDRQVTDEKFNDLTKLRLKFGKQLKETMNKVYEKIKEALEQGTTLEESVYDKIQELYRYFKEKKDDVNEEVKEFWENIAEKMSQYITDIGLKTETERNVHEALADFNIRDTLLQIKEHLKNNIDLEYLKEKLENIFGQGSELLRYFLQLTKEKAKNKMLILIDGLLDEDGERAPRGFKDYWEKIKNYFRDLKIDLQEKYIKFGEWVKENLNKGMEASKDKIENIKIIANVFTRHAKGISKEVANEAAEFFRQYKKELGNVWDEIKERIQEIRDRKD